MYKIKQIPEDFIVKEINEIEFNENGQYSYFLLKKKNYNTLKAINTISQKLRINEKNISFAGNKDRSAITEQLISVKNGRKTIENIQIKDIELKFLGKGNEKIFLGNLQGNDFMITIRNLVKKDIKNIKNKIKKKEIHIPNYFGRQRFSINNSSIGKAIIKNNFKEAIDLIIKSDSDYNENIKAHLKKQKNDFVGALKIIPFRLLKLYVHSYQSFLFNKNLEQYIKLNKNNNKKLPIIGFGTELQNNNIKKIIKKIMQQENIDFRDFIIRQIPDLSSEGNERNALIKIDDFKIIKIEKDELNKNKEKIIITFSLPKGSYATVLIDYLFS